MIKYWASLFLLVILTSCFDRKEGCLDTLASNYDVSAFDACEDCCTFPNLVFRFNHRAGDSLLRTQDTLINDLGQLYNILEVRFYVSEVELFQNGSALRVKNALTNSSDSLLLPDDIKIARSNIRDLTIGEFVSFGNFEKVSFRLGVEESILRDSFVNLPSTHPLTERNKIRDANGNLFQMSVRYTLLNPDTLRTIWIDSFPQNLIFEIEQPVVTRKGENILFDIKANYLPLFQTINLASDTPLIKSAMTQEVFKIFE